MEKDRKESCYRMGGVEQVEVASEKRLFLFLFPYPASLAAPFRKRLNGSGMSDMGLVYRLRGRVLRRNSPTPPNFLSVELFQWISFWIGLSGRGSLVGVILSMLGLATRHLLP
ncbi:hypothetical protein EYF80_003967 [Liparis tanakae]|uniref:Uncharacterized protein n=1 Tax=Liparis tanakae TaxID=230148 RepID=A0A4Z2J6E1_9TELE|nr:hypothetical protein EYF80_003967 [Liparis tanakae]